MEMREHSCIVVATISVLADIVMPGMSGVEACEKLLKLDPHVRILFMTGYTDQTVRFGKTSPTIIRKPFVATELIQKVRQFSRAG
jgi:CheY-like chemotaxis protein